MPRAEFSEDHFEQHLIAELRECYGRRLPHFKPSRLLEKHIGYDFAINTSYPPLHAHGVHANDPRIVGMLPAQQRAMISGAFVTTFVQCKRPDLITKRNRKTTAAMAHFGRPFYRFGITAHQNALLAWTEQALGGAGIVRYAAPCFSTFVESDDYCIRGQIAQRTHYVSPGPLAGHGTYAYVSPLQPGRAYSEPAEVKVTSLLTDVSRALVAAPAQPIAAHVSRVWAACSDVAPDSRSMRSESIRVAERVLQDEAELPLFPFGDGWSPNSGVRYAGWPDQAGEPTLRSFAAAIIFIERFARDVLEATPRTFIYPGDVF